MLDGDPCGWPAGDGGKVTSMHGPASDEPRRPYVPMALVFFFVSYVSSLHMWP
jgi:hypothetical protein